MGGRFASEYAAALHGLAVGNRAVLVLSSSNLASLTVEQPVPVSANSGLTLNDGVTLSITNSTGFDLNVQSGSVLTLGTGAVLNANSVGSMRPRSVPV